MHKNFVFLLLAATMLVSCKKQETENQKTPKIQAVPAKKATVKDPLTLKQEATSSEELPTANVAAFFKSLKKKPQVFTINTSRDTILNCRENTKITIHANSFVSQKSGREVSGKISFQVTEYYNISDMIFAGLSTRTNGKLLETGGMLYLTATSNGEECRLKTPIEIEFPATKEKPGMGLYSGNWQQGQINWQLDKNAADLNEIYSSTEVKPEFPGGISAFYKFVSRSITFPDEDVKTGKIIVNFIVERDGKISNPQIVRSDYKKPFNESVLEIFAKMPSFIPAKTDGVAVRSTYTLPITIASPEEEQPNKPQRLTAAERLSIRKERNTANKISHAFATLSLNWVNCDRVNFFTPEPEKIDYAINVETKNTTRSVVVLKRYKVILNAVNGNFGKIPKNENATLVVIKYENDKFFLCMKETKITSALVNDLAFNEISKKDLIAEIKKLNRFN